MRVMLSAITALFLLPGSAKLLAIFSPEGFVDALGNDVILAIPGEGSCTFNGAMGVASKTDRTAGEGSVGVLKRSGLFCGSAFRRGRGRALTGAGGVWVLQLRSARSGGRGSVHLRIVARDGRGHWEHSVQ